MVQNTVHATYTETYDLNTAIGEVSLLGIHTPQAQAVKKMFKGFFEQYKKYKILGCNLSMVCASQQALTPDLVGQESGQVDPRDVLNPILFKACTGESMNLVLDQVYNSSTADGLGSAEINSSVTQHTPSDNASINSYYQMLADDTFRREHPQKGLTVMGLRPFVHKVVTTQPFKWTGRAGNATSGNGNISSRPVITGSSVNPTETAGSPYGFGGPSTGNLTDASSQYTQIANPSVFVSDGITDMPWLETTVNRMADVYAPEVTDNRMTLYGKYTINDIPRVYMGLIVLPPAIAQRLFFRMSIVWHIAFKDFRPAYEVGPVQAQAELLGPDYAGMVSGTSTYNPVNTTYFNIYHNAVSSKLPNEVSSFSTTDKTEVDTVMETVN